MLLRLLFALIALSGLLNAHNVPSMTIETRFKQNGNFDLTINFDPRAFLAADPRTLPPVVGSWFSDQSPEQAAATLEKARDYLMRLPARMAKVSERLVIPNEQYTFKWVNPATV